VGAISYAVTSGSLPAGLSLSTAGAITGTPTTASTTAVTFSITATDSSSNTATGVFTIAIAKGTPTVKVTLTSGSNPSFIDNAVTFKATVADAGNTPSGTVTFYDGSTQICSATVTLVSGAASCTVNNNANPLPAGANSISASYSGDTNFVAVANTASTLFAETLEDFTISAASSAITVIPNYTGVFTATIAPLSPATTLPGSVALSYTSSPAFPSDWTVTFSQTSVASGSGSTAVTMNIQTALTTAKNGSLASRVAPFSLALLLLPFAGLLRKSGKRFGRMVSLLLLAAAGVVAMAGVSGCNQSGFFGQAPVTYTVTINGSAGSSATGILSHNANTVTLTVE
jgi:hypothetical protein